jgi:sugar/nucleoside kinase (ribokinase family)
MFISIGSIIIDDIILPDGQSRMGVLGGGCTHAVMGMRVWSNSVGLVSAVGNDFPKNLITELSYYVDTLAIVERDLPTPRAWQLFEKDGTRNEVFRTDMAEMVRMAPKVGEIPSQYFNLAGVHLHSAVGELPEWLNILRKRGNPIILWEPWNQICLPKLQNEIYELASQVDVFSPGLSEAKTITGLEDPIQIAKSMISHGVRILALRMGAAGSLVAINDKMIRVINAIPVEKIVDVTGAGNSYCGGFIVGLSQSNDPFIAGCYAATSASFSLGQFGAFINLEDIDQIAKERMFLCKTAGISI